MKRKLLSMLCLLSVAITSFAAEKPVATLKFGTNYNDSKVGSYTSTWTATNKEQGITWEIANFNNNNNDWNYVRCGSSKNVSVATITNKEPFTAAISKVTVTIDAITTGSVNSIKLYVSADSQFPEGCDSYDITKAKGVQTVAITNPVANAYYKLSFDCAKGSSNGLVQVSQVDYYAEAGAVVIDGLQEEYTVAIDGTIDLTAKGLYVSPDDATLSYAVIEGDSDGLTFNGNVITANKEGTYTVTLTGTAGDSTIDKTFKVTVTAPNAPIYFSDQIVYGKLGIGVVFQTVTSDDRDLDLSVITYTSSDPEKLVVDANTGQIIADSFDAEPGVKAAGEYYIEATLPASDKYSETKVRYEVIIIDPNAEKINGFDIFDFTTKNPYGMTSQTNPSTLFETKIKEINADGKNGINYASITFNKISGSGYRSWNKTSTSSYELRVQAGTELIFEVPDGFIITQIGLTGSELKSGTFNPLEQGHHGDFDEPVTDATIKLHWHRGKHQKVNKVTLSSTDNLHIDQIFVMYDKEDTILEPAELSFENTYVGVYNNEPAKLPAVSNPHNLPVTYSIQNLDESLYSIVPSKDGKTIEVTFNIETETFGLNAYTLEAHTAENDTYRTGYAIMRLNVYEHLNITCTNVMADEEVENVNDSFAISGDEDDMYLVAFDVPEGSKMFYQLRLPNDQVLDKGMGYAISEDGFDKEDGFLEYNENVYPNMKGFPLRGDMTLKMVFYISSYGYKSPKRTIYFTQHIPLVVAFGGDETTLDGTFTYTDHSVTNKDKHIFKMEDIATSDYLFGIDGSQYPAAMLVDLSIEPMFTPVSEEDIPDYDKDNDAMKYEDAEAWFEEDDETYALKIKTKHAGKYLLTTTLNVFTANPGQQAHAEIEVTPNLDGIYMHGIDLADAGNGTFKLTFDMDENPKGRVEYIGTGHPVYGEGNGLWYQLHYDNPATSAGDKPQYAATPDEDKWVKADGSFNLLNEVGDRPSDIHLKLTTNGVTKVKSYAIGDIETAVAAIEGADNGEPIYIDMNGMVVTEPSNGLYIRVVNGRADKVMIVE